MWMIIAQDRVKELNEALNDAILFSRERRPGHYSRIKGRTWEGMEERLERILELFCEVIVWEQKGKETNVKLNLHCE